MGTNGFWAFYESIIKKGKLNRHNAKKYMIVDVGLYLHKMMFGIRNNKLKDKLSFYNKIDLLRNK
jgi:hypothetical protein